MNILRSQLTRRTLRHTLAPTRRLLSTETTTAASADPPMKTRTKVIMFTSFLTFGSLGTFSYMISSDDALLYQAIDEVPWLVNFVAPYIGLPVEEATGVVDVEELGPRDVSEVVGERLLVVVVLKSGRVLKLDVDALAEMSEIESQVQEQAPGDEIADLQFVDQEDVEKMQTKSEEELGERYTLQVPALPAEGTKEELQVLLFTCRMMEREVNVQMIHAAKLDNDQSRFQRTLDQLEQRKKEIKAKIKSM